MEVVSTKEMSTALEWRQMDMEMDILPELIELKLTRSTQIIFYLCIN